MVNKDTKQMLDRKKYIIFDFDQTLVWMHASWGEYVNKIITKYEHLLLDFPFNVYEANIIDLWNFILKKSPKSVVKDLRCMHEEFEETQVTHIEYNPDLINLVKELCGKKSLYIWSGNCSKVIDRILKELKIYDCFDKIITADQTHFLKPETDGLKLIYNKPNRLEDYVLIGDSQYDYLAAKNARIDFFAIDYFKSFAAPKI